MENKEIRIFTFEELKYRWRLRKFKKLRAQLLKKEDFLLKAEILDLEDAVIAALEESIETCKNKRKKK